MIKARRLTTIPFFQGFKILDCGGDPCGLDDFYALLGRALNYLWFFAGTVAVLIVLWGAYQFITAAGDPAKAESARKTLFAGAIGAVIVVAAWAFTRIFAQTIWGNPIDIPINLP